MPVFFPIFLRRYVIRPALLLGLGLLCLLSTVKAGASCLTVGGFDDPTPGDAGFYAAAGPSTAYFQPITVSAGWVDSISFGINNGTSAGHIVAGLYYNNPSAQGFPAPSVGLPFAQAAPIAVSGGGLVLLSLPQPVYLAAGTYWVGWASDVSIPVDGQTATSNIDLMVVSSYDSWTGYPSLPYVLPLYVNGEYQIYGGIAFNVHAADITLQDCLGTPTPTQTPPPTDTPTDTPTVTLTDTPSQTPLTTPTPPPAGTLITVAGNGSAGYAGDGGPGTLAQLSMPLAVAVDASHDLYIADTDNGVVRKVDAQGRISTFAGPATSVVDAFLNPVGLALDASGDLYIADGQNNCVWKVGPGGGTPTLYAGTGNAGDYGDGGPALNAQLDYPNSVAVDAAGDLYIADTNNAVVREVLAADQSIRTVAGGGQAYDTGGSATGYALDSPQVVALGPQGDLYIGDDGSNGDGSPYPAVYRVDHVTGLITLVAGNPQNDGTTAPSLSPALAVDLGVTGLAVDAGGNVFISNGTYGLAASPTLVRLDAKTGLIQTVAGLAGVADYAGDNGPASAGRFSAPAGLALDPSGDIFIADSGNSAVREIAAAAGLYPAGTPTPTPGPGFIVTAAGNGTGDYLGDGGPAGMACFYSPVSVRFDTLGNAYVADQGNNVVRRIDASTGMVSTVAGGGYPQDGLGDGLPATAAALLDPVAVALDSQNNLYISDSGDLRVRRLDAGTGIISTVAGNGQSNVEGGNGDGGPATQAEVNGVNDLVVDGQGDLYLVDNANGIGTVRKVSAADGSISTIAGGNNASADGGPPTSVGLGQACSLALDGQGGLYIGTGSTIYHADLAHAHILAVAGPVLRPNNGGALAPLLDGGPALGVSSLGAGTINGLAVDAFGGLYFSNTGSQVIRRIDAAGILSRVAGQDQVVAYSGDGGPATVAAFDAPMGLAFDPQGGLWVADAANNVVRRIRAEASLLPTLTPSPTPGPGTIVSVAGDGTNGDSGDGGPALDAQLNYPKAVHADAQGDIYIADADNSIIRRVDAVSGAISTVAGGGAGGGADGVGDGGPATSATLSYPGGFCIAPNGDLYIADADNDAIRKVDHASGIISVYAGTVGYSGYAGDNGPATGAQLSYPGDVVVDAVGNVYIADAGNDVVRKVDVNGAISTLAGAYNGGGSTGDGGPASAAQIGSPASLALDPAGKVLYVGDQDNYVVRSILLASGQIGTVAGVVGVSGDSGDGGPARKAEIYWPYGLAVDGAGNLYIADDNAAIRVVHPNGSIGTVAGGPNAGYGGDGGPASAAALNSPNGVGVDAAGDLYIADTDDDLVRKVAALGALYPSPTPTPTLGPGSIVAAAGTGVQGYLGDGFPALSAQMAYPQGLRFDRFGNAYVADTANNVVRRIDAASGVISTVAGDGIAGYQGDGGPATGAQLDQPQAVALDSAGDLFIADSYNHAIRRVDAGTGLISTVAGNGSGAYAGDGGAAIQASLWEPQDVVVDAGGGLYIADGANGVIRYVTAGGVMTTYAGQAWSDAYGGDNGPALGATFGYPVCLALDAAGDLFIGDANYPVVRRVAAGGGSITAFAGQAGQQGYSGDGGPAPGATLQGVAGLAVDSLGGLYIGDGLSAVRKVGAGGIISTVAGGPAAGDGGDGGPATAALLNWPEGVAVSPAGDLWVADTANQRLRRVLGLAPALVTPTSTWTATRSYTITPTITATSTATPSFSATPAWTATASPSASPAATPSDSPTPTPTDSPTPALSATATATASPAATQTPTFTVTPTAGPGTIITYAGNGDTGYEGDGVPATATSLNQPSGVYVDPAGNVYVADLANSRVRKIAAGTHIISTFAGTGANGFSGDGLSATAAAIYFPRGVVGDGAGNIYIADSGNERIRKVAPNGVISTVAGNGGYSIVDGGLGTASGLNNPMGLAVDAAGDLYIADQGHYLVRKLDTSGVITTVAGVNGVYAYNGDNIPATSAGLNLPGGVAVDGAGDLYIADTGDGRVRKVDTGGTISTVAGNGVIGGGISGDGGPATLAVIESPNSISIDGYGDLYITDQSADLVRQVDPYGIIRTVAGKNYYSSGYGGDGGPVLLAQLDQPNGTAVDPAGDLFISDNWSGRVREALAIIHAPVDPSSTVTASASPTATPSATPTPSVTASPSASPTPSATPSASAAASSTPNWTATLTPTPSPTLGLPPVLQGQALWLVDGAASSLVQVDLASGAVLSSVPLSLAGSPANSLSAPSGLAVDPISGAFYIIVSQAQAPSQVLARVDPSTGSCTVLGATGFNTLSDLAFDPTGGLFAGDSPSSGLVHGGGPDPIVAIDKRNGACTVVDAQQTMPGFGGMAFDPQGLLYFNAVSVLGDTLEVFTRPYMNPAAQLPVPGLGVPSGGMGSLAYYQAGQFLLGLPGAGHPGTQVWLLSADGRVDPLLLLPTVSAAGMAVAPPVQVKPTGSIFAFAGNGSPGPDSGDGGLAWNAAVPAPNALAIDAAGDVFIGDNGNSAIREVLAASGDIQTVVATGYANGGGGLAVDAGGDLYWSEPGNHVVRKRAPGGVVSIVAGTWGVPGYNGDGGPGALATLNGPQGLAVDAFGGLYICDTLDHVVRRLDPVSGLINTVAGSGASYLANGGVAVGDGGPAVLATLGSPVNVAVDGQGGFYVLDTDTATVRKVGGNGIISTVAGSTGMPGYGGDGVPATSAMLVGPGLAVDLAGDLFISDIQRVREVLAASGTIQTVAGTGSPGGRPVVNGILAVLAALNSPQGVAMGPAGDLYIADTGDGEVRRIPAASASLVAPTPQATATPPSCGFIAAVAGQANALGGASSYVPALGATLDGPTGVWGDNAGHVYFCDGDNGVVRRVDLATGLVVTVAGGGSPPDGVGDGGPATSANLIYPTGLWGDLAGNLYIADSEHNSVRRVDASGMITTVAGISAFNQGGYSGDGGPATAAQLDYPLGLWGDGAGDLYIADSWNNAIRQLKLASGFIGTVAGSNANSLAGSGTGAFGGDGGSAKSAFLNIPAAVWGDATGLYILDSNNQVLRKVDSDGNISTIAGSPGVAGYGGDGGPAVSALLDGPGSMTGDGQGDLFISDTGNGRIRIIGASGRIVTGAGVGAAVSASGDGGSSSSAQLASPQGLWLDQAGRLYVADGLGQELRVVYTCNQAATFVGGTPGATPSPAPTAASTASSTPSATLTATPSLTFSPSATLSPTPSGTPGGTLTDSPTPSLSPSASPSPTVSATLTASSSGTPTGSPTATPTASPTVSATLTASPSGTPTRTRTATLTASASATVTLTPTATRSATMSDTPSATATASATATPSPTASASVTLTPTLTDSPTVTETWTPSPSPTPSATPSFTPCYQVTLAGNGASGTLGDGGPATLAQLTGPQGVAYAPDGSLVIADAAAGAVRRVGADGVIHTLVITAGPALQSPACVYVDGAGVVYVGDQGLHKVLRIDLSGTASVVAGSGSPGPIPMTTVAAVSLNLASPVGLGVDVQGRLYIADAVEQQVYRVGAAGDAMVVAGNGTGAGPVPVSGLAAAASLVLPNGLAVGPDGDLYISCQGQNSIVHVGVNGGIGLLAGSAAGTAGASADGSVAAGGAISGPSGLVVDRLGALYFVDNGAGAELRSVVAGRYRTVGSLGAPGAGLALGGQGLALSLPASHLVQLFGACGADPSQLGPLPVCGLSQWVGVSRIAPVKPSTAVAAGGAFPPVLLGPSPARVGGGVTVRFAEPMKQALVGLYDLTGRRRGAWAVAGASSSAFSAPQAPGLYFVHVSGRGYSGAAYQLNLKLAVLP